MSTHKNIDKICVVAIVISLIISVLFMNGSAIGIQASGKTMGYEERLFSTDKVHTIDIVIDDWDAFISTAQSEEYSVCSVVIDGETVSNVGIRGKGNTSLSTVSSMDSERYSFKIEFDQYDNTKTYHGLDKLCLNNLIQDNTYMKDYLTYQMMGEFGVATPLCSYAYITVNGEDWGLYLAVEAVEESFLQRNYGSNYGELYKPDSMNFGGGRGNGKDFDMSDFMGQQENGDTSDTSNFMPNNMPGNRGNNGAMSPPSSFNREESGTSGENRSFPNNMMGGFGGMGSSDVKLQYIDDNPDSYANIFDSAKTNVTEADQNRLIESLKQLSEYENLNEVVNVEDVLRYFVIHNYVVNGDSYTGSMIHNYYLYEENGQMSMIPWDYNLAFGTFQGGSASSSVNDDIGEALSDRPMQAWIFSDDSYSQQYYELYAQMLEQIDVQGIIDNAYTLIAPYVEKDPTAFCTADEFKLGVETLKEFCSLRTESVKLQLSDSKDTVDTGDLNLSDMGTMSNGMGGFGGRGDFGNKDFSKPEDSNSTDNNVFEKENTSSMTQLNRSSNSNNATVMTLSQEMEMPEGVGSPENESSSKADNTQESTTDEEEKSVSGESEGDDSNSGNFPSSGIPNFGDMENFDGMMPDGQSTTSMGTNIVLLAISVLFLGIGLFVAFKFKR